MRDRFKFLRRPPTVLSASDDAPLSKRPKVTNDVETSAEEMDEYKCNTTSLQKEMEKKKPKSAELCSLMEKTYQIRKKWIQEEQPNIGDMLSKFPAFKKPKVVSHLIFIMIVTHTCTCIYS